MQHADHFTRILNERESFRREKNSASRFENNPDSSVENVENSNQNSEKETIESSSDENKIQKNAKPQVEII